MCKSRAVNRSIPTPLHNDCQTLFSVNLCTLPKQLADLPLVSARSGGTPWRWILLTRTWDAAGSY